MWRWCHSAFKCFSGHLPCYLLKGPLRRDFLDIYLTTCFGVRNFKNRSAMRVIFCFNMYQIESKFRKCKNRLKNILFFGDNCSLKCCFNLFLLRRKYLLSAVNGLTNSSKILHITQTDFFNLNWFTGINKYDKGAVVQISTVFSPFYHVTCWRVP